MIKTSHFLSQLECPTDHTMTPIRDYKNDYFHLHDDKLPKQNRFQIRNHPSMANRNNDKYKFKRPASLHLDDMSPSNLKKQYSPLNIDTFKHSLNIRSTTTPTKPYVGKKFFEVIKELYSLELEYAESLEIANTVYRQKMNGNRLYRNQIIEEGSNDEMLLFGNLETISSISRLFTKNLERLFSQYASNTAFSETNVWDDINKNSVIQEKVYSNFNIGELFNLHYLRLKSTYLSYCVSHRRQMELFDFIKVGNRKVFQDWYECCLIESNFLKLEDIFTMPLKRLRCLVKILNTLLEEAPNVIKEDLILILKKSKIQFEEFLNYVEEEINIYDENKMYDFSLTPIEIIQNYGDNEDQDFERESETLHENPEPVNYLEVPMPISPANSGSSSRYSGDPSVYSRQSKNPSFRTSSEHSYFKPQIRQSMPINSVPPGLSLSDHIGKFKKIYKDIIRLEKAINETNYFRIIENNMNIVNSWGGVIYFEQEPSYSRNIEDGKSMENIDIYESKCYLKLQMLMRQKEEIGNWKEVDLKYKVMEPIRAMIDKCQLVRRQLKDLQILKKDYAIYLKERKNKIHDVKREVIAKHFENVQQKIVVELPKFINLISKTFDLILVNHTGVMLKYYEILSGGPESLRKDIIEAGIDQIDSTGSVANLPNLDILQEYSNNRYLCKKAIRENWQYRGSATSSKVVRRLFEL
ncbi:hypothetical protein Kpol_1030p28 [Vanderwaltozyma polyspora DSM 70294]|uniref:DH domain-containing protein n=1 Tax=Vanderwaltozyma polyspora (strain ATCC 22028 / DSM 70294 / BCRC 21397 / CBS 2163 / NBRC 10782 / NRRL Y-8283 / UCD 57-17) TaxID=436907 RepID=A7TMU6_VANPO|nr:uncharacterized protein Kpol_1030p28 [Vanderwaltozyma polyspora DSM 70294]EDO16418.1 hypothetical protein Kpol_1030p28 [Vanderwaltozyma polyspora DSM 70294]